MTGKRLIVLGSVAAIALVALTWGGRRPPQVSAHGPTPDEEVAFLEERVGRLPGEGLERAALASAYFARGRHHDDDASYDRAREEARRSLELLPYYNAAALGVLAELAAHEHDFREAERLCREVLKLNARSDGAASTLITTLLALGETAEADVRSAELARRLPTAPSLQLRALVLERTGRDDAAQATLERALGAEGAGQPQVQARTLALLARLHLRQGRVERAHALSAEALELVDDHGLAVQVLAEALVREGQPERAASLVLRVAPKGEGVDVWVGGALAACGRADLAAPLWDRAERALRADIAEGPSGHDGLLAALILDRGDDELPLALELAQRDAARRADPMSLATLARALQRAGRLEEALAAVERALAPGLRDPALLVLAAGLEDRLGRAERAQELRRRAHAIDSARAAGGA